MEAKTRVHQAPLESFQKEVLLNSPSSHTHTNDNKHPNLIIDLFLYFFQQCMQLLVTTILAYQIEHRCADTGHGFMAKRSMSSIRGLLLKERVSEMIKEGDEKHFIHSTIHLSPPHGHFPKRCDLTALDPTQ